MPAKPELDLVAANPDLQFPGNVHYNFVYWSHTSENADSVLPHVVGSDAVAFEMSTALDAAGQQRLHALFDTLSSVSLGQADEELMKNIETEAAKPASGYLVKIAFGLRGSGTELFIIDRDGENFENLPESLNGTQDPDDPFWIPEGFGDPKWAFDRENLALRQLSQKGRKLSTAKESPRISILYGANHHLVSVAARRLGANVTRTFVDKPTSYYISATHSIEQNMSRWGLRLSVDQQTVSQVARLVEMAMPECNNLRDMVCILEKISMLQSTHPDNFAVLQTIASKAALDAEGMSRPRNGMTKKAMLTRRHTKNTAVLKQLLNL